MSAAADLVTTFIRAIERRDLDAALELVAEGCVYDNVPMATVTGRDAIRATLEPFLAACTDVEWVVSRQVAEGRTVMNERLDRFETGGRWLEIPVMGVFEVDDDRITLWRDYFDLATFTGQRPG